MCQRNKELKFQRGNVNIIYLYGLIWEVVVIWEVAAYYEFLYHCLIDPHQCLNFSVRQLQYYFCRLWNYLIWKVENLRSGEIFQISALLPLYHSEPNGLKLIGTHTQVLSNYTNAINSENLQFASMAASYSTYCEYIISYKEPLWTNQKLHGNIINRPSALWLSLTETIYPIPAF